MKAHRRKQKTHSAQKDGNLERCERVLLLLFLVSRVWLFFSTRGQAVGWDTGSHLAMLDAWPWSPGMWSIESQFYAYHPPLAFLLARTGVVLGLDPATSVQAVAALASVVGFLFLRASLRFLQALSSWQGVLFLYVTSSLPLQIYLARSINMDIVVYAAACASLYFSLRLCGEKPRMLSHVFLLVLSLSCGLYTKFSGVLLLALPPLIAALSAPSRVAVLSLGSLRRFSPIALAVFAAVFLASPYYVGRYYLPHGMLFPSNMDLEAFDKSAAIEDRAVRDRNKEKFWREFFVGNSPDALRIQDRDQSVLRFRNTWRDLWSANKHNVRQSPFSLLLSSAYAWASLAFFVAGTVGVVIRRRTWSRLDRVGIALVAFSFLEIAFLIAYTYRYPHPIGVPNKAIYIAPAVLGVGYLLTAGFNVKKCRQAVDALITFLCGGFVLLNAVALVY